jgi:hypothetical protein
MATGPNVRWDLVFWGFMIQRTSLFCCLLQQAWVMRTSSSQDPPTDTKSDSVTTIYHFFHLEHKLLDMTFNLVTCHSPFSHDKKLSQLPTWAQCNTGHFEFEAFNSSITGNTSYEYKFKMFECDVWFTLTQFLVFFSVLHQLKIVKPTRQPGEKTNKF